MARSKSIAARRHRKIKAAAKGFHAARRKRVKSAKEAILHAGDYAYRGRKMRKRNFRSLWIMRLNAAARENGLKNYNQLVDGLKQAKIELNRKMLSDIAISDPETFTEIAEKAKSFTNPK